MYTQSDNSSLKMANSNHFFADQLTTNNTADWYVAYTQPRQESIALANLQQQNFEAYLPLFKILKKPGKDKIVSSAEKKSEIPVHHSNTGPLVTFEPMFPRYIFFRPADPTKSISTVRSTRGVNSVLMFGANLAVIRHEILQTIRDRELQRNQAPTETISPFQPGSHVRFRDPAFQSLAGLVQSVSAQRIVLLLELLGREKKVEVQHDQVELA